MICCFLLDAFYTAYLVDCIHVTVLVPEVARSSTVGCQFPTSTALAPFLAVGHCLWMSWLGSWAWQRWRGIPAIMADNFLEECSNLNPKSTVPGKDLSLKKKRGKETGSQFEYCKVCSRNHDQGQRHKYFPSHKKSLSIYLSRFESKLADICFFLKNPIALRPEHDSRNRFWCIFCDIDVQEFGSSFAWWDYTFCFECFLSCSNIAWLVF